MSSPRTTLYGIGTAVPPHIGAQDHFGKFLGKVVAASAPAPRAEVLRRYVEMACKRSGIDRRYTVLKDYVQADPEDFEFFGRTWSLSPFPGTAARMRVYEHEAVPLAARAAKEAMAEAGIEPRQVTHLVITSCTGFFAPGPDVALVRALGLAPTTQRTLIGFMGCYAGFNALRTADQIVRGDPDAVVLQVSVELCSLHFQRSADPGSLVANALFADGASAAVYGKEGRWADGLGTITATHSLISSDTEDQMSWHIGDHGFEMYLDSEVPKTLRAAAPGYIDGLFERAGCARSDVRSWAIHPGGPKIVAAIGRALELGPADVAPSNDVLRDFGNMSSATILFVIREALKAVERPTLMAALGFGPGLTMEGAILEVGR